MTSPALRALSLGLVAATALYAALSGWAVAAPSDTCEDPRRLVAMAIQSVPGARIVEILQGEKAKDFVAGYNMVPPESDFDADYVLVIAAPGVPAVLAIGVLKQCVSFSDEFPADEYIRLKGQGS